MNVWFILDILVKLGSGSFMLVGLYLENINIICTFGFILVCSFINRSDNK